MTMMATVRDDSFVGDDKDPSTYLGTIIGAPHLQRQPQSCLRSVRTALKRYTSI
jgi:hypothetical protein